MTEGSADIPGYVLQSTLGRGAMGVVHRARHRLSGRELALKRLSSFSEGSQTSLINEFKVLSTLHHPNVVRVFDYGLGKDTQPYFTMELLEPAIPLTEATRHAKYLDDGFDTKVALLTDLLQALIYVHRRGIVHRDLKPTNVLVSNNGLKVLDFGVATHTERGDDEHWGTLYYAAPELWQGQQATVASDLYAVGMMAFELLCGHGLFSHKPSQLEDDMTTAALGQTDRMAMLTQRLRPLPPVAALGPLQGWVARLLAPTAPGRFVDAETALRALYESLGKPLPATRSDVRESLFRHARLVGRDAELQQLGEGLTAARSAHASVFVVGGESGVGKSRLVDELRTEALCQGMLVVQGCAQSEGSASYQMWREALRPLVVYAPVSDEDATVLHDVIPDLSALLGRPVAPAAPMATAALAQERLFNTVVRLIHAQPRPLLILLEDAQWSAKDSLQLVNALNAHRDGLKAFVVVTYRHDESPDLPKQLPEAQSMLLTRLSPDDMATLSASMLGPAGRSPRLLQLLREETEGNVFFLIEVLQALADQAGSLADIARMQIPEHMFVGGIRQAAMRRLTRVPSDALSPLRLAAVAGRVVQPEWLRAAMPHLDLDPWLTTCSNAGVLEVNQNTWRFAHDKLREALMASIPESERRAIHGQLAQALARVPVALQRPQSLAHHWYQAGHPDKALPSYEQSGHAAGKLNAWEQAYDAFAMALRCLQEANVQDPMRYVDCALGLAQYGWLSGAWDSIRGHLTHAEKLLTGRPEAVRKLAYVHYWTGRVNSAAGDQLGAIASYRKVIAEARDLPDRELQGIPYSATGTALTVTGNFKDGLALLEQSAAPLKELELWPEWVRNRGFASVCMANLFRGHEAKRVALEAVQFAEAKDMHIMARMARVYALMTYVAAGDLATAEAMGPPLLRSLEFTDEQTVTFVLLCWIAISKQRSGQLKDAQIFSARAQAMCDAMGGRVVTADLHQSARAECMALSQQTDEALAFCAKILETLNPQNSRTACAMAHRAHALALYQKVGALSPEVLQSLERSSTVEEVQGTPSVNTLRTWTLRARMHAVAGDQASADTFAKRVQTYLGTGGCIVEPIWSTCI